MGKECYCVSLISELLRNPEGAVLLHHPYDKRVYGRQYAPTENGYIYWHLLSCQ